MHDHLLVGKLEKKKLDTLLHEVKVEMGKKLGHRKI
jgi:hypothetical protein